MSRLGVLDHDPQRAAEELEALCALPHLEPEGIFTPVQPHAALVGQRPVQPVGVPDGQHRRPPALTAEGGGAAVQPGGGGAGFPGGHPGGLRLTGGHGGQQLIGDGARRLCVPLDGEMLPKNFGHIAGPHAAGRPDDGHGRVLSQFSPTPADSTTTSTPPMTAMYWPMYFLTELEYMS